MVWSLCYLINVTHKTQFWHRIKCALQLKIPNFWYCGGQYQSLLWGLNEKHKQSVYKIACIWILQWVTHIVTTFLCLNSDVLSNTYDRSTVTTLEQCNIHSPNSDRPVLDSSVTALLFLSPYWLFLPEIYCNGQKLHLADSVSKPKTATPGIK